MPQHITSQEIKTKRVLGIALVITATIGLFSTMMLMRSSQDLRQDATGAAVELRLSAREAATNEQRQQTITTTANKTINVLVEVIPGSANVSATDFVLTYDPTSFEYVSTELFSSTYGVLLKKEVDATNGKVRLAIGKQPGSTASGNQQLVSVNFTAKNKIGTSTIGLDGQTIKVAALGNATNVYQGPTAPISATISGGNSGPQTSLELKFKLAGVPVENNPNFLPEVARTQPVKISLQNMSTGEITTPQTLTGRFVENQFVASFTSTTLTTGKYNILLKGPKHQQIRFCKNEQTPEYRCLITDGIEITKDAMHNLNFSNRRLSCGDLPISGTNKDQQDGAVRVTDYSFMVGCLSKRTDAACVARADCNSDGSVTNLDMDLLLETLSTAYDQ